MSETCHASCVTFRGKGLLILGASGRGKSTLALDMMALGADLVADDRVILTADQGGLIATCPPAIKGQIEARFVGVLKADPVDQTQIALVVDLDRTEAERLPPPRTMTLQGISLPLLFQSSGAPMAPALIQYLKCGALQVDP